MRYYNVHTHNSAHDPDEVAVVNTVVCDGMEDNTSPYRSYGIHPWYIYNVEEQMEQLRQFALLKETVAIGEAGLDKLSETDFAVQEDVFRWQIRLAEELKKPLIIHCVKAWTEILALKKEIKPTQPWIIHGFRGKPELARQLTEQGIYLSFGSQFNPTSLQKAWPDYVLAETDEKELSIQDVYQKIADFLTFPLGVVASQLAENNRHIFCL